MEPRLHLRLQVHPDHGLGNSVGHGGHPERPDSSCLLRYLHGTDRRREVAPRGETVPELVEVPFQVLFKLGDRLSVDTGGPVVGLDLLVGLEDLPLGDVKRLGRL